MSALPSANEYVVLSPYLVPKSLRGRKVVNLGDGFILKAIERLIGKFPKDRIFSTWEPLPETARKLLPQAHAILIAGANQLNDCYTVLPGVTLEELRSIRCPIIPIGVGIHGLTEQNQQMTEKTRGILREIHARIPYSSWRCPLTVQYLSKELPEIRHQLLMTGCPVIYDAPLLNGTPFSRREQNVAVTVTERGDFWQREAATLQFVAERFRRARRYLVLHQNFTPPSPFEPLMHRFWPFTRHRERSPSELRRLARALGFEVVIPADADEAIRFYYQVDLHVGSRLHAHLLCLSRAKRSFLVPVDNRVVGIAEAFGFPLCDPNRLGDYLDFEFDKVRAQAQRHFQTMSLFIQQSLSCLQSLMLARMPGDRTV